MSGSWIRPKESTFRTGLKLFNTLTQSKEEFFTNSGDRRVYWYMCGPTVYCDTHMGHARTYITSDVIRRILSDYFGYQVTLCMNITDIDDKIINTSTKLSIPWDQFARNWEEKFFEDMEKVNVRRPDILTRVSEYVPEIITYVEKIIQNNYAYVSNGSVYFDTEFFKKTHNYIKLEPSAQDDVEAMQVAEGNTDVNSTEKKRIQDFALWKKSKEGEPFWQSPFGEGRPGWHIECSVMSSDVLPCPIDIHSGGIDLRFPHHDNEIAQCEAYFECQQWVNYFLHTGHLHIQGRKMSRSLKNFITIKEILTEYTSRQLRMFFLLHKWDGTINYSETSLQESIGKEKQFKEFLMNTTAALRNLSLKTPQKPNEEDRLLLRSLENCRVKIHEALCDNLSTDKAVEELSILVNKSNIYLQGQPRYLVLSNIRGYILKTLEMFGLEYSEDNKTSDFEPLMDILSGYREKVRSAAREKNFCEIFKVSDLIRDEDLPKLGIILEDVGKDGSRWKKGNPEEIAIEIERKAKEEESKKLQEEEKKRKQEEMKAEKEAKIKIKAEEMFRNDPKYSQWDEKGIPTHYADGKTVSKSEWKKLVKLWEKQKALNKN